MLRQIRHLPISRPFPQFLPKRSLSASQLCSEKALPPRLKLSNADITTSYLKGTGPGGQKINKTNSAVQLIHKPTGIVVKSQATRSRSQNEKIARQLLADKVEQLLKGDESRVTLKAERKRKKKASRVKKSRRKYRELEAKGAQKGEEEEEREDLRDEEGEKRGE
ncbi:peptide chain release factor family protein [Aspergillus lucknowensis]|uniref:RF-1 domain-containing protein n=1 Tax=Aspergillus lucknowensis TaxID=176173 RepID=A0ABR4M415_9EURO